MSTSLPLSHQFLRHWNKHNHPSLSHHRIFNSVYISKPMHPPYIHTTTPTTEAMKLTGTTVCEVCHHQEASLYCPSDAAFLCSNCDSQVHAANFLVARHIRHTFCSICKSFTFPPPCTTTTSSSSSSSSSSSCIAPNTTSGAMSDWKTRDVLLNWCTRVGVTMSSRVVEVAIDAFEVSWVRPYRVGLAASLWFSLSRLITKKKLRTILKSLEEISGVPAKSIVVAESQLAGMSKIMKHRRRRHHHHQHHQAVEVEEGWAEC